MNIVVATTVTVPNIGGMASHIETLIEGLSATGHSTVLLCSEKPEQFTDKLRRELGHYLHKYGRQPGRLARFLWEHKTLGSRLSHRLSQTLLLRDTDLVSCQDVMAMMAIIPHLRKEAVPCVLTVHDYLAAAYAGVGVIREGTAWERRFLSWEREAYRSANKVVCVDTRLACHVSQVTDNRVRPEVIFNCPHPAFLKAGAKRMAAPPAKRSPFTILCPRRLHPKNGVIYAVEMAQELKRRKQAFVVHIAGTGEERSALLSRISEYGLEDEVKLLGALDRQGMIEAMMQTDAVIVPSIHHHGVEEATSISVMEAMSAGVPVVGSNIGGIAELIEDGQTGILVPQKDPSALADAIMKIMEDPDFASAIARAAYEKAVRDLSHIAHASRFVKVFEACIR